MLEDIQFLEKSLIDLHPGLYNHQSAADFQTLIQAFENEIGDVTSQREAFRMVAWIVASTDERHTVLDYMNPSSEFPLVNSYAGEKNPVFPFRLKYIDGKVYIWRNYSRASGIPIGSEVLEIDKRKVSNILDHMSTYIVSDGCIQVSKYKDATDRFPFLYPLVYKPLNEKMFLLKIRTPQGSVRDNLKIAALSRKAQRSLAAERYPAGSTSEDPVYNLFFEDEHSTAILKLKSFFVNRYQDAGYDHKDLYRDIFDRISTRGSSNLVLDLRDNPGGDTQYMYEFLTYLLHEKNQKHLLKSFNVDTGKDFFRKFPKPSKHGFRGKLYLLVNTGTFSNASALAAYAREFVPNAEVVGIETSGRYSGLTASSTHNVTLPNCGLTIKIPTQNKTYFLTRQKESCRGLLPDREIHQQALELLRGEDRQLNFILELISGKDSDQ